MSTSPKPPTGFWQAYLAIALSFVVSRVLNQTDLIFIAPLGSAATAAFAVPGRLMFIDAIVAFALGPVISIAVSRTEEGCARNRIVRGALGLTFMTSCLLVVAGLIVYPRLADALVDGAEVRTLAQAGIFWMTWSIPLRMLVFVSTMCLFASRKGRQVTPIYGVTLIANGALDWLLVNRLGLGFEGAYLATFAVSSMELVWLLGLLARLHGRVPFGRFGMAWGRDIGKQLATEWLRLASWQAENVAVIALLASNPLWLPAFGAFGVIAEFQALALMPFVALMRTAAMQLAQPGCEQSVGGAWRELGAVRRQVLLASVVGALVIVSAAPFLGEPIYRFDEARLRWWSGFAIVFGLSLPVYAVGNLLRACFQTSQRFGDVARVEVGLTWLGFVPMLWLGLLAQNPWIFFSAYFCRELGVIVWLRCLRDRTEPGRSGFVSIDDESGPGEPVVQELAVGVEQRPGETEAADGEARPAKQIT